MTQFYLDPSRESEAHALPDAEAFYLDADDPDWASWVETGHTSGWYWWTCLPGCLPDSEPCGPFDSEDAAIADAREGGEA